jgi:hypothetical protein
MKSQFIGVATQQEPSQMSTNQAAWAVAKLYPQYKF